MSSLNQIKFTEKVISSWNKTYKKRAKIFYPKKLEEIKEFIKKIKSENIKYIIKTGECSYDSKSINVDYETYIISLKNFNRILKINKKESFITVQSGSLISNVIYELKNKGFTLSSIPGGEKISIGGAISANVIGKDASFKNPAFGDAVLELIVMTADGVTRKIMKNNEISRYIGAFGMSGIILQVKLKIKKISSKNLNVKTNIFKNLDDIKKNLDSINEYNYVQVDPFFREKNFAIGFSANFSKQKNNIYKAINLQSFFFERWFFILSSFFINKFTWKFFYKVFFLTHKDKNYELDLHNYHYSSKYKHMVPLITKKGLVDYEILVKNKFKKKINSIFNFLKKNNLFPIYIVIKKIYKSKKIYTYNFNDNGYAVAISLDKFYINRHIEKKFLEVIDKNDLKLNLSKTDTLLLKKYDKKNNLFMSYYKKKVMNKYEVSR